MSAAAGVGLDLLDIGRLERALARRPGLEQRLFTEHERGYSATRGRPGQHLAARFCAKEAVAKALGLDHWSFHDVEVRAADGGAPSVALAGTAAERAQELGVRALVSLTHTHTTAGAAATLAPA